MGPSLVPETTESETKEKLVRVPVPVTVARPDRPRQDRFDTSSRESPLGSKCYQLVGQRMVLCSPLVRWRFRGRTFPRGKYCT